MCIQVLIYDFWKIIALDFILGYLSKTGPVTLFIYLFENILEKKENMLLMLPQHYT